MTDTRLADPLRRVAPLQNADDPSAAPPIRARANGSGKMLEVLHLQSEPAEWISGERVEAGRDEHQVGHETFARRVDASLQSVDIIRGRERGPHWDVPDALVGTAVAGGACSGVPRPLVHRHESDVGLTLDQRLGAVTVMHVPVYDEDALEAVRPPRVMRRDCDVAEQTEPHRTVSDRVVAGWPHRRKAVRPLTGNGKVDAGQNTPGTSCGRVPRALADNRIRIQSGTASFTCFTDTPDIFAGVRQLELLDARVSPLDVIDDGEKGGILPQRSGDGSETSYVLRMAPAGVMPSAIAV